MSEINAKQYLDEIDKILDNYSDPLGLMNEYLRFVKKVAEEGLDKDELHIRFSATIIMFISKQMIEEKALQLKLL